MIHPNDQTLGFDVLDKAIKVTTLKLESVAVGDAVCDELDAGIVDLFKGGICEGGDDAGGVEMVSGELNEEINGRGGVDHRFACVFFKSLQEGSGFVEGFDPVRQLTITDGSGGEFGNGDAELITAAESVGGTYSRDPFDIDSAGEEAKADAVNCEGLAEGVDEKHFKILWGVLGVG